MAVSWENVGCRSNLTLGGDRYQSKCPGKRCCHYIEVSHCICAYADMAKEEQPRGKFFHGQLNGTEPIYKEIKFAEGEGKVASQIGEERYLEEIKKKLKSR